MKKYLVLVFTLLFSSLTSAVEVGEMPEISGPKSCNQPGRYVLVQHSSVRADQFLVDTCLGRIWERVSYTDIKKDVWKLIPRTDTESQLLQWQMRQVSSQPNHLLKNDLP